MKAYPLSNLQHVRTHNEGMDLRDYFAAAALQGLLAQSNGSAMGSDHITGAVYAYEMADAMMEARAAK